MGGKMAIHRIGSSVVLLDRRKPKITVEFGHDGQVSCKCENWPTGMKPTVAHIAASGAVLMMFEPVQPNETAVVAPPQ
jgi:hypothetical protein